MREVLVRNEEFKDSPLGRIPKDWKVLPLECVCLNVIDCPHTTPIFRNDGVLIARTFNIRNGNFNELSASRVSEEEYRQRVARLEPQTGDVIFTREAPVGEAFIVPLGMRICLGQRTMLLRPDSTKAIASYVLAQIYSGAVRSRIEQLVAGTTNPHLNVADVRSFLMPVPSLPEQQGIAEILDTVDEAIARTSSLIIKLKQTKAGLLQDLLTRGLDEDGKLRDPQAHPEQFKDSPLGQIPKDWEAKPLAAIADLQVGFAFKSEWFQEHDGVKLLRGENVGYGVPDWSETRKLSWNMYFNYREYELVAGDIIIGMDRTFTKSGVKISVLEASDVPALLVQRVGRFLPIECDQQFLKTLLSSQQYHNILLAQQKGMDIPHLSKSEILDPLVTVPPIEEQIRIAAIIDTHNSRICTEEAYLNKLKLQKQGLMQDLLTGKVRVKNL